MNRHLWGLCLAMITGLLGGSVAIAQAPAPITVDMLTAANVRPHMNTLQQHVQYYTTQLITGDNAAQTAAREALINAALPIGSTDPGPAYLDAYARTLNEALVKVSGDASVRARLNAAIVTARVAAAAENYHLAGAAIRFMGDDALPVSLWGLKASEYILPQELRNPLYANDPKVLQAIQKAVEKNPAGPIVDEAYESLRLRIIDRPGDLQPRMIETVLPIIQQTLETRVQRMVEEPIETPIAEARATFFLTNPRVWPVQTAQQKLRTVQLINNLIHVAAQRIAGNAEEIPGLVPLIQETGKSLEVVGQNENSQAIQNAARTLSQISDNTPPAEIIQRARAVQQALQAAPTFSQLEPAPTLQPASGGRADSTGVVAGSSPR